ncbi:hypothetical protein ACF07L_38085 [Streptomyces anulatus]|uniref:hypothetical protein n=1 Tax=Streptomyces anulatus TaxID=1892 RepID=UPI003702EEAE
MGRIKQKRAERAKRSAAERSAPLPQPRLAERDELLQHMLALELDDASHRAADGTTLYALAFDLAEGSATVFFHDKELRDDDDGEGPYWTSGLMIYPDCVDATDVDLEVGGLEEWRFHPDHLQLMRDIEAMVEAWDGGPWDDFVAFTEEDLARRDAQVREIYDRYASRYPGRIHGPWEG